MDVYHYHEKFLKKSYCSFVNDIRSQVLNFLERMKHRPSKTLKVSWEIHGSFFPPTYSTFSGCFIDNFMTDDSCGHLVSGLIETKRGRK